MRPGNFLFDYLSGKYDEHKSEEETTPEPKYQNYAYCAAVCTELPRAERCAACPIGNR